MLLTYTFYRQNIDFYRFLYIALLLKDKMIINCIIVDDSASHRINIIRLVNANPSLNLVADYSNPLETKAVINAQKIDLIFLEIDMPLLGGFELLDTLTYKPQIIFTSKRTEYAIKAFDYNATDFIEKPVTKERFNIAIKKALAQQKLKLNQTDAKGEYIFVKSNLKRRKVYLRDIKWIEALGDYVKIITEFNSLVVLSTMKAFEKKLPQNQFLRIHKSYIISLGKVERFNSKIVEIGEHKVPLSRNKKIILAKALDDFIGLP